MQSFHQRLTITEPGLITLTGLPFESGQAVEVFVLPQKSNTTGPTRNLRGSVVSYVDPFEPAVKPEEWEAGA